ncbi:hypothetical protein ACTXT7_008184 [Hymenolepis weldensis]
MFDEWMAELTSSSLLGDAQLSIPPALTWRLQHALSTTFRPIGEPNSNSETDPETEGGVSSSSRSSRFEGGGGGQAVSNPATPEDGDAETSGGASIVLCRLCLREFRPLPEPTAAVCSSLDCGASFHQECFAICIAVKVVLDAIQDGSKCRWLSVKLLTILVGVTQPNDDADNKQAAGTVRVGGMPAVSCPSSLPGQDECENETGSLYCPVCGRVWSNALTPTNPGTEGATRRVPAPPAPIEVAAIAFSAPSAAALESGAASFLLLQNQIIPGLKSCLSVWKSVFSEESDKWIHDFIFKFAGDVVFFTVGGRFDSTSVYQCIPTLHSPPMNHDIFKVSIRLARKVAMGIISPYWHVRQSALRQVAKITICRVLMARKASTSSTAIVPTPPHPLAQQGDASVGHSNSNYMGCESLRMSIRLIQYLLSDPADEVFIASLHKLSVVQMNILDGGLAVK